MHISAWLVLPDQNAQIFSKDKVSYLLAAFAADGCWYYPRIQRINPPACLFLFLYLFSCCLCISSKEHSLSQLTGLGGCPLASRKRVQNYNFIPIQTKFTGNFFAKFFARNTQRAEWYTNKFYHEKHGSWRFLLLWGEKGALLLFGLYGRKRAKGRGKGCFWPETAGLWDFHRKGSSTKSSSLQGGQVAGFLRSLPFSFVQFRSVPFTIYSVSFTFRSFSFSFLPNLFITVHKLFTLGWGGLTTAVIRSYELYFIGPMNTGS